MQNIIICLMKKCRFVWKEINNSRGFTLVEALLSFCIFLTISFSLLICMKGLHVVEEKLIPPQYYEWNLFRDSFRTEFRGATLGGIAEDSISFYVDNKEVLYEKYADSIRRRVNRKGHEIVLQKINEVNFSMRKNGVQMEVEFTNGEKAVSRLYNYKMEDVYAE
ncbi:competence type IV pilus minor pilin ComGF [Bacillus seohaeanensis]|uniref:Competence type IV pilus minor pilin ComGF n=1 Tax=Bacillus seohaeanensis TaxID=284580 RepID=A0ABW5RRJ0_9BACI